MTIDPADMFRPGLPAPAPRWTGFPEFNFVGGHNDPDSVPVEGLRRAADAALGRDGRLLATYALDSGPLGHRGLRDFLADKLRRHAGIACSPDEILLTSGSLQAIDLVNEVLLAPGDAAIVEESNYGGVLSRLARRQVRPVPVPLDGEGMRMDALEETLDRLAAEGVRPRCLYTIPTVHNPTGTILPADRRARLLELAARHALPVLEDECYADLVWSGTRPPALRALDREGRVIHVGSFSKSVAPALRVGYVVADPEVLAQILAVKTDAGSGALEQMVLAEYCPASFDDHLVGLRAALERKLDTLIEALERNFGAAAEFERPPGGIFLWVKLPEAVDAARLAAAAAAEGVEVNPGPAWSLGPDAGRRIRLCYANPDEDAIRRGVARLAEVCRREFGVPEFIGNVGRG